MLAQYFLLGLVLFTSAWQDSASSPSQAHPASTAQGQPPKVDPLQPLLFLEGTWHGQGSGPYGPYEPPTAHRPLFRPLDQNRLAVDRQKHLF
jgi:hypothetical protein